MNPIITKVIVQSLKEMSQIMYDNVEPSQENGQSE